MKQKKIKKVICAIATAGLIGAMSVMPVFAGEIENFPLQKRLSYSVQYTRGMQAMMTELCSKSRNYIIQGGGIDGSFGEKTELAVKAYQEAYDLSPDGQCGTNTWKSLSGKKVYSSTGSSTVYYSVGSNVILQKYKSNGVWWVKAKSSWYKFG